MANGATIISTTLPTIVGMGVVAETTRRMFGKGKQSRKAKAAKAKVKVHRGPRGGTYVIRKGRKVYI